MTRFDLWPEILCPGDVTGDGQVDVADLSAVLNNFGRGCE
jgi:hypothetical protein